MALRVVVYGGEHGSASGGHTIVNPFGLSETFSVVPYEW